MAGAPMGGQMPNINQAAAASIYGSGLGALGEMGYAPTQTQAGQLSQTNLQPYMNPYTSQVIDQTAADLARQEAMQQNVIGAQATRAGAFGGSREAIQRAATSGEYQRNLANLSANLRQTGYQQAQTAAQQDIANRMAAEQFNVGSGLQGQQARLAAGAQLANIGNLGFGMGQTAQQNLMQQGALQQALQQQLYDAAAGQYAGYQGAPAQGMGYLTSALSSSPIPQSQTSRSSPGLFDIATTAGMGYLGYLALS
jgi:hypothetical protein